MGKFDLLKLAYLAKLADADYRDLPQKDRVLKYLHDFGSITPLEAMRDIGVMRLGARVWELIQDGWPITKETETSKNRYGHDTRYANYRMAA